MLTKVRIRATNCKVRIAAGLRATAERARQWFGQDGAVDEFSSGLEVNALPEWIFGESRSEDANDAQLEGNIDGVIESRFCEGRELEDERGADADTKSFYGGGRHQGLDGSAAIESLGGHMALSE